MSLKSPARGMFSVTGLVWATALVICSAFPAVAQDSGRDRFLSFVRAEAAGHLSGAAGQLPQTLGDWSTRRTQLRAHLEAAWGGFPDTPAPLEPRILEVLDRPAYRIEKLTFQTLPGVWMTANAWVPKRSGRLPAVLCVHGHWQGAKQDPHVQARCAGLAALGFFVLAVDAFGAGERGVGKALGEYHGEMTAATLFPLGRPLSGIQVYENMRAVDYLSTRPEVDVQRLGITGASGGGNQSMYAGAWDERFRAVVPVCSVGTYQAYLGAACCMCEVVPGAMTFTEESGVLALVAPRALMVISATQDAFQFSVGEAQKSVAAARSIFDLHDRGTALQHVIIESPHDYNQPMREAMYGFMTRHLAGSGNGSPIAEPQITLEEPETLRCYPGETRPDDWLTLPRFAAQEAGQLEKNRRFPTTAASLTASAPQWRQRLDRILGGTAVDDSAADTSTSPTDVTTAEIQITPDPGIPLTVHLPTAEFRKETDWTLLITTDGLAASSSETLVAAIGKRPEQTARLQLRGTGTDGWAADRIGRAPDHNSAEWSLWIGRPLLGQWVRDIRTAITALERSGLDADDRLHLAGSGAAAMAVLCAAALDRRIDSVTVHGVLASWVTDRPYEQQRLAILPPGILRDLGDVEHIAALVAPATLKVLSPTDSQGQRLAGERLEQSFGATRRIYGDSDWTNIPGIGDVRPLLDVAP
ncbi:MAG: alpha/beta hydrolase family protein [Planctomycetota bacterium]